MNKYQEIFFRRKQAIWPAAYMFAFFREYNDEPIKENRKIIYMMNKEYNNLGYRMSYDLIEDSFHIDTNILITMHKNTLKMLQEYLNKENVQQLFPSFPDESLYLWDIEMDASIFRYIYKDMTKEEANKYLKKLDINLIGYEKDLEKYKDDNYKILNNIECNEVIKLYKDLLNQKKEYNDQDKKDISILLDRYFVDFINIEGPIEPLRFLPEKIITKYNSVYITKLLYIHKDGYKYYNNVNTIDVIKKYNTTYTDVLKFVIALSNGDISLNTNSRFRNFKRAERKDILELFESCSTIDYKDLLKYKTMFIRLGERIHPGEYAKRYPKTAKVFNMLRNDEKTIKEKIK